MNRRACPGPSRQVLWALVLAVVLAHGLLLWGAVLPLTMRLASPSGAQTLRLRLLPPPAAPLTVPTPATPRPAVRAAVPKAPVQAQVQAEVQAEVQAGVQAEVPLPDPVEAAAPPSMSASEPAPLSAQAPPEVAPERATVPPTPVVAAEPASAPASTAAAPTAAPTQGALTPWPVFSPSALPDSRVLSYQLTGMDKGLTYHASGELRWQHNQKDYALTLSVRAFLIGRRQWRSVGRIESGGLAPQRFSDSWRQERAAHFDRLQQRIVFSSNSTPAALEPGAQDQISLYVQLAAAMAGAAEPLTPGTRLQVQTATVRDAQPWSLTLEGGERLNVDGQDLPVLKWVCQPRNRFEARVEFWVAAASAWLPLRIRITQSNGSYIDLAYRSTEPLPPLPEQGDAKAHTSAS